MKTVLQAACVAWIFLTAGQTIAQVAGFAPGDYVINQGVTGNLSIKADQRFTIGTVGANAHICSLDGLIVNGQAKLSDSACLVNFKVEGPDIRVTTGRADDCRGYCGMRAGFEGLYRKPPSLCTRAAMDRSRKLFKQRYDAKNYAAALDALNPLAIQCGHFNDWLAKARIANDLALTQFKLGDRAACLKTLAPLVNDAAMTDAQIRENNPPADADAYLPAVRATRTNLKLCGVA